MGSSAIEVSQLVKRFGVFTAVDDISFEIAQGELFGLLGPNGAGKTTTLSILATLLAKTAGSARVNGFDVNENPDAVRQSIGIVFQDPSLDFDLTARENLDFHARLYKVPASERAERVNAVLALVELSDKADWQVKTYSGGMRRRLEIARGLLHRPKVLFLDEPTLGLDPQTRRRLWTHIKTLNQKENLTIILTTHYLEEADFLCDRIAIIDAGKIVALETPSNLKKRIQKQTIVVDSSDNDRLRTLVLDGSMPATVTEGGVQFLVSKAQKALPALFAFAKKNNIDVRHIDVRSPSLEDVFVDLTGHSIREEHASSKDIAKQRIIQMRGGKR